MLAVNFLLLAAVLFSIGVYGVIARRNSVMVLGGAILAIALTDHLIHVIFRGNHRIQRDLVDQSFGE